MSTLNTTNLKNESSVTNNIVLGADGSVDLDGGVLYVDAANNRVGVGTTSPSGLLHLFASSPNLRLQGSSYPSIQYAGADDVTDAEIYYGAGGGNDLVVANYNSGPILLAANGSERARIDSSGRLLVGTSSGPLINESQISATGAGNTACFKTTASSNNPLLLWNSATSGDNILVSFFTETSYTARGNIDYNRAAGQVRYNTTSDQRLKINIQDSDSSLNILGQIKVRSYDWAETGHSILYGFVAQELHQAVPDAVKVGDSGDEVINAWAVDNSKLVPLLTKALQEAMERIEILEAKVAALEAS